MFKMPGDFRIDRIGEFTDGVMRKVVETKVPESSARYFFVI
jgi:hypothetical protein